jgi:homoserine O-acetyltransferase/O-succinyltransferase
VRLRGELGALVLLACAPPLQFAQLGDFPLENGEVIRNCRVGYRTFGRLAPDRSNAVLMVPWAMGTSRQLAMQIGPGRLVDDTTHFIIAVDAFGNGVSSSPSNSPEQPGPAFPRVSMRDLVESQRQLLTRVLGVDHLRAVVGISAGGMQVFQWVTLHPELIDEAVAIAGSPRSAPRDRQRWRDSIEELRGQSAWERALRALKRGMPRDALRHLNIDVEDFARQGEAIESLDVSQPFGGSLERAAAAARTRMLVVVSARDEVVDPAPALEFARLQGAEVVVLDGRCGHLATSCERKALWAAVRGFLGAP